MKKIIKINYVAKSEGHTGLEAKIIDGKTTLARMEVKEGARLIEGILKGRKIEEVPVIVSRICGMCPVVHNLTAIKALESALNLKVSPQIILLRKVLECAQIIQSHTLHIFFLSLSDYFGFKNSLDFARNYSRQFKNVIKIRDFVNKIIKVIGGRTIHLTASVIGGFLKSPDKNELEKILKNQPEILESALELFNLVKKVEFPEFSRETEYIALKNKKEYGYYEGDIYSNKGLCISAKNYSQELKEFQRASEVVNLVKHKEKPYLVGPLARINLSSEQLNKEAKKVLKILKFEIPNYNPFYNNFAQMVEVVHFIEETKKLLKEVLKSNLKKVLVNYSPKEGQGVGIIEAPRGILIHSYEIDKNGRVLDARAITPTAQFLFNLEKDLEQFIPTLKNLSPMERRQKIEMLVRAYDLCISCAVH